MSKGFLILAQNTENVDYVRQAYALALSIKNSQKLITNVSLVTNDPVPDTYKKAFDQIIEIPWVKTTDKETRFRTENRWKLYHITPYEETIVLDSDMLVLEDITLWWNYLENYDINFCSKIKNYKLDEITDNFYRRAFVSNDLSSPYFALHYFKKSELAYNFYKILEFVCNNWEWFYNKVAPINYQNWASMDLTSAITIELLGNCENVINGLSPLEFIHMKPAIQGWQLIPENWQDAVPCVFNSKGELIVGNIKQSKIFHYVESEFLTNDIILKLEKLVYG